MTSGFDSFGESPLGVFSESPLKARGGAESNIYASGDFSVAGGILADNIAKWDGKDWTALGSGLNGRGRDLEVFDGNLYVCGDFTTAGGISASRIAKWDGSSWSALGTGLDAAAFFMKVFNGKLVVGGSFTDAGGVTVGRIAQWDGSTWSALQGSTGFSATVQAFTIFGGNLIAGGNFTTADGNTANKVAQFDGTTWDNLGGSGFNDNVLSLVVVGNTMYAAGGFTTVDTRTVTKLAQWSGFTWDEVGSATKSGTFNELESYQGNLIIGGIMTIGSDDNIVRWNGSVFSPVYANTKPSSAVLGMGVSGDFLYAGGLYTSVDGISTNRIGRYEGATNTWTVMGTGMNSLLVDAIESFAA